MILIFYHRRPLYCLIYRIFFTGSKLPVAGSVGGRLGQALRSDVYADFHEGQLTLVNHSRSW